MQGSGKTVTLKDIAQDTGLSTMAVSKALNGKGGVSEDTLARILEACERLHYTPNTLARSLRLSKTDTLGVVISDSSHSFFPKVIKGIEDTAAAAGYNIILSNTDQDVEKEKKAIQLLVNKRIDGIILAASMLTRKEDLPFIQGLGIPCVFLIRRSEAEEVDYVINDNVLGAWQMTRYLIGSGSRRIHFLNLYGESPSGRERYTGYAKALTESGIPLEESLICNLKPTIEEGYSAMREILDRGEQVHTVFCGCDVLSIGAMEAILDKGLRIPEDIRVAAYDDIDFAAYLRIPLTTVRQPKDLIGSKGTELLLEKIRTDNRDVRHIILKPELIIRRSA